MLKAELDTQAIGISGSGISFYPYKTGECLLYGKHQLFKKNGGRKN